jgi:hypothetical protein
VIGPAAEPLVGGVPVAAMQVPGVRSCAVADTVCVNVVADVHVTEVVPDESVLLTVIEEPDTDATAPDASGRVLGTVVVVADEADVGEPPELPHAAPSTPTAATRRTSRPVVLRRRSPSGNEDHTLMSPPAFIVTKSITVVGRRALPLRLVRLAVDLL